LIKAAKVGGLAQSLLELVRLEHGFVQPVLERFSLIDLVQDIFQKFELTAEARQVELKAHFVPNLPTVCADLGLIERVLTNLMDNALRHTPHGGEIELDLKPHGALVDVTISDTGPGLRLNCAKACSCGRSISAAHGVMVDWACASCTVSCNCTGARFSCWTSAGAVQHFSFRCQQTRRPPNNGWCAQ
jgi:signal transduction histidine kinase